MSEFFTGVTFQQQKVTPSDDAAIRKAVLADSILSGCALSYAGSTLTMGAGMLLGCGRQFRHTFVQNWAVTGANSGYARLVLTLDMSKASTKDTFNQVVDSIEYASSLNGFLQLQQDDINEAGTIYQMEICVVSLGAGGITGIVSKLGFNPRLPTAEEIGAAPAIESTEHPGCFYRMVGGVQEWLNPPMEQNVEYRTTKRHNGEAVYTKFLTIAPSSFTDVMSNVAHGISNLDVGLSIDVNWMRSNGAWRKFPSVYYADIKWLGQVYWDGTSNLFFEMGETLLFNIRSSPRNILATLEYTKHV